MADTPPTPPAPPAPPRRKATTGPRKTTRATPPKSKAPAAEDSATPPVKKPAARRKAPTRKPAAAKAPGTTVRVKTAAKSAAKKVGTTASGAASKVAGTAASARQTVSHSAPVQLVSDTRERMGDRNFFAAVIGGIAALGAAVGGIFYAVKLGGGARTPTGGAHQADGTDASASFNAGIADEGTIPD